MKHKPKLSRLAAPEENFHVGVSLATTELNSDTKEAAKDYYII